jgi:hypothetical protein
VVNLAQVDAQFRGGVGRQADEAEHNFVFVGGLGQQPGNGPAAFGLWRYVNPPPWPAHMRWYERAMPGI